MFLVTEHPSYLSIFAARPHPPNTPAFDPAPTPVNEKQAFVYPGPRQLQGWVQSSSSSFLLLRTFT